MIRRTLLFAAFGTALLAQPAAAAEHVPGEVVVRYEGADGGLGHTAVVQTGTERERPRGDRGAAKASRAS